MYRLVMIDTDSSALNCINHSVNWNALGFDVVATFSDEEEALEYLKCTPADAVLLPAELPETTGIDVAEFIHQSLPGCAVVMTGAARDFDFVKRAMQCGACDYIGKPVDPEELRRSLEIIRNKLDAAHLLDGKITAPYAVARHLSNEHRGSAELTQRVMAYVDRHILENVNLEDVSKHMHISSSHLIRVFKKETGYTFLKYVTKRKMEKAAEYFAKENLKVREVSERLGYHSTRHFSTLFYKQFGCYPSEYYDTLESR